ncbi:palmitoyltransferas-like protein PFA3 [Amniculicola lignicola CBS 123094]|uniref:Palmitoyltransferase n=1 Tax=Amniculicola lignicola CBS 123094 TaxID=1392246 RepID=A0A6A5WX84_9PLEO|nr:palmitoyltransferas-like protein PFA3 [Amniculicola lignicola CBS 123094]
MATLGSPSPPSSPSRNMRRRGWARRVERTCCNVITYFPLLFVYGLTTWAVWVEAGIGLTPPKTQDIWTGAFSSVLGIFFYLMLNWSYTTAVFTDPGSPLNLTNGYSHLPAQEEGGQQYTSYTVKASDGGIRYCKKCQTKKPDRAHHCSTCGRCVLKMDHHCPWLATCVGLHNYKAFVLFLLYLSFFCWTCFAVSAAWVWKEILHEGQYTESFMPVNYVLLAVLSGIIGLVITGFTAWHLWLTTRGQTTIESLEKTRYLSPLRNQMNHNLHDRNYLEAQASNRLSISDQLREIHGNILPGVTRPEEGESSPSRPASRSSTPHHTSASNDYSHPNSQSYEQRARQREVDRYSLYLDERDNELLPNAFDLGPKRNILHVFGPVPYLWLFPVSNTTGDGWSWEAGPRWLAVRDNIQRNREMEERAQKQRERAAGWGVDSPTEAEFRRTGRVPDGWQTNRHSPPTPRLPRQPNREPRRNGEEARYLTTTTTHANPDGRRSPSKADQILGRERGMYADGAEVPLQTLNPIVQTHTPSKKGFDQYNYISDDSSESEDEPTVNRPRQNKISNVNGGLLSKAKPAPPQMQTESWNDIPEAFLQPAPRGRERRKEGGKDGWDDWGHEGE